MTTLQPMVNYPPQPNTPTGPCKMCSSIDTYWKYHHISAPAGFDSDDDQYSYERECNTCDDFYGFKHEAMLRVQLIRYRYLDSMIEL